MDHGKNLALALLLFTIAILGLLTGWFTGPVSRPWLEEVSYTYLVIPGAATALIALLWFGHTKKAAVPAIGGFFAIIIGVVVAHQVFIPHYAQKLKPTMLEKAQKQADQLGEYTQRQADDFSRTTWRWYNNAGQYVHRNTCDTGNFDWASWCRGEKDEQRSE